MFRFSLSSFKTQSGTSLHNNRPDVRAVSSRNMGSLDERFLRTTRTLQLANNESGNSKFSDVGGIVMFRFSPVSELKVTLIFTIIALIYRRSYVYL
jgi:hypothetical protein